MIESPQDSEPALRMEQKSLNYRPLILVILLIAGLVIIILLQLNKSGIRFTSRPTVKIGAPAPDFTFADLNGSMVRLSDYRGKIVLVNIWATWCPPCIDEMPSMQKLYQEFKDSDFEILAVSVDAHGAKVVAPFMQKHNLTFPALLDAEATIKEAYGATGVPESFIIDRDGILIRKIIGPLDWASPEILRYFRNLLQKPLLEKGKASNSHG